MQTITTTPKKIAVRILLIVLAAVFFGAVEARLIINGNHSAAAVWGIFIALIFYSLAYPECEESKRDFHESLYK